MGDSSSVGIHEVVGFIAPGAVFSILTFIAIEVHSPYDVSATLSRSPVGLGIFQVAIPFLLLSYLFGHGIHLVARYTYPLHQQKFWIFKGWPKWPGLDLAREGKGLSSTLHEEFVQRVDKKFGLKISNKSTDSEIGDVLDLCRSKTRHMHERPESVRFAAQYGMFAGLLLVALIGIVYQLIMLLSAIFGQSQFAFGLTTPIFIILVLFLNIAAVYLLGKHVPEIAHVACRQVILDFLVLQNKR